MRKIVHIRIVLIIFLFYTPATFAQTRRMPGGSAYFSSDTIRLTKHRDSLAEELNLGIHAIANGNHSKNLALRAYLYEYCAEKAKEGMIGIEIPNKRIQDYQKYIYFQTSLYQYLQPTVQKARYVLHDNTISFPIILEHLQSNDPYLLSFYHALPDMYQDSLALEDITIIDQGLRRYVVANDTYPQSLTDLIAYNYIPNTTVLSDKKILYRAYNIPYIISYLPDVPRIFIPKISNYVLFYQVQLDHNKEYIDTLEVLRRKIRTFDFQTRSAIKKTPHHVEGQGVGRKIDISNN